MNSKINKLVSLIESFFFFHFCKNRSNNEIGLNILGYLIRISYRPKKFGLDIHKKISSFYFNSCELADQAQSL